MFKKISDFLIKNDSFLLSSHLNADGDAIGSLLAVGTILKKLKKKHWMVLHDNPVNPKFKFLKDFEKIISFDETRNIPFEVAVFLDTADSDRLGTVKSLIEKRKVSILNIDHHVSNLRYGTINLVDSKASSTCEIICNIIEETGIVTIDKALAYHIYTGITYDTFRFAFSNTTVNSMRICTDMVKKGVDCHEVSKHVYFEKTLHSMKILGEALKSLELHCGGRVGFISLEKSVLTEEDNFQIDLDNLVNYTTAVEGVEVGIFLRRAKEGGIKVSLRSKDSIDVNRIARIFNGGGHSKAAGCRMSESFDEAKRLLLKEVKKAFR
jgi:phosphoesterase RecJ-like protein